MSIEQPISIPVVTVTVSYLEQQLTVDHEQQLTVDHKQQLTVIHERQLTVDHGQPLSVVTVCSMILVMSNHYL